jgi:Family of unknown function (DUF5999)
MSSIGADHESALHYQLHPAGAFTRPECTHEPRCPDAAGPDRDAAHVIISHPEQGWSLLCNGVVLFEDCGEILPDGECLKARRAELTAAALHRVA